MAKKSLGQHFLKDPAVFQKIIAALEPQEGETIFEIGPGHGELTLPLARACAEDAKTNANASARVNTNAKSPCKIIAIEKDATLAAELKLAVEQSGVEKIVEVVEGDALKILHDRALQTEGDYRLAGNIPYYITGHLLRVVGELEKKPERAVLMVQKEVAERIAARPPEMNRLAASVQFWSDVKIIGVVGRENFSPPPQVDSAIIRLERVREEKRDGEQYYSAVRTLFAQPRKTVLNNLSAGDGIQDTAETATAGEENIQGNVKEKITAALKEIGVDPNSRPQNLTVEAIVRIAEALF